MMVGSVLRGLENANYGFKFNNILLVDGIKNVFKYVKLSHPLNWTWANLPVLSPIFLVILASIIFIVFYLYKTSELMNKKKLTWLLITFIFLFILANILIIQKRRPPEVKFRLILIPVQSDSTVAQSNWIGHALWNILTQQLQSSVVDQAIISPVEWTQGAVKVDSIYDVNYLKRLNSQLETEYVLAGKLSGNDVSPNFTYQMIQTQSGEVIIKRSFLLVPQNLPEISSKIRDDILDYFDIDPKIKEAGIRYTSADVYQKYLTGKRYYQQKKYQFALDLAEQTILADSGIIAAFLLAGKSWFMKGLEKKSNGESPIEEFEKAKQWLTQAVALDSSCDEAYSFLGEYYIYRERWSLAEQMLVKAYHLNPHNPRLYLSLSRLHPSRYQKLSFRNEKQLFQHSLFINPCYEDAYLMLSDYYLFENKREKAIQVLEHSLDINPNSVPVLMALGKIYLVRNEILKIIEILNRVLELEPNNSDAYYNLGILYYNSKDYETAEKFLIRAIAIDNHLNAYLYLAYLYEIRGEYDKAIAHLRKRIRYRKGLDDEFAEEARKHLFKLLHQDSTDNDTMEK
ncbi:MAG: tetratricopeptide repeat protein [bacterium]|nr:MAG: tetratricopeptide repeat protein [bacterium]